MTEHTITFLHPLNEKMRFFLRISFLFQQAKHTIDGTSILDSHAAIRSILDIIAFINQQDFKKEVLKELERISHKLAPMKESPDIKHGTLTKILASIDTLHADLHAINGPLTRKLNQDEFLKVLQQRANIAGGFSEFDPPIYCHWLMQPATKRTKDLNQWLGHFESLYSAVDLILDLIKESTPSTSYTAENGCFQQTLDAKMPYQLLIISLPANSPYFAEVSGGKHRFTIRFMDTTSTPRPTQTSNRIQFNMSTCAF